MPGNQPTSEYGVPTAVQPAISRKIRVSVEIAGRTGQKWPPGVQSSAVLVHDAFGLRFRERRGRGPAYRVLLRTRHGGASGAFLLVYVAPSAFNFCTREGKGQRWAYTAAPTPHYPDKNEKHEVLVKNTGMGATAVPVLVPVDS